MKFFFSIKGMYAGSRFIEKFFLRPTACALVFLFLVQPFSSVLAAETQENFLPSSNTTATLPPETIQPGSTPAVSNEPLDLPDKSVNNSSGGEKIMPPDGPLNNSAIDSSVNSGSDLKPDKAASVAPAETANVQPLDSTAATHPDPKIDSGYHQLSFPKADKSTGALVYEYPLTVPPGRNGLQPELSLQYNSQNSGEQGSMFGDGWSLNLPYIQRANKRGVDKLYTGTDFTSSLSGELVPTSSTTYVSRVEDGSFIKYEFSNNTWTATDKNGTRYEFGKPYLNTSPPTEGNGFIENFTTPPDASNNWNTSTSGGGSLTYTTGDFSMKAPVSDYPQFGHADASVTSKKIFSGDFTAILKLKTTASYNVGLSSGSEPFVVGLIGADCGCYMARLRYVGFNSQWILDSAKWTGQNVIALPGYARLEGTVTFQVLGSEKQITLLLNGQEAGRIPLTDIDSGYQILAGANSANIIRNGVDGANMSMDLYSVYVVDTGALTPPVGGSWSPSRQDSPEDGTKAYKWMLDTVTDTNGNTVKYQYSKDKGQIYPSRVTYGGSGAADGPLAIDFIREARPDVSTSSKPGFYEITDSRINRIAMSVGGQTVRSYDLAYAAGDNGVRSLLSGITETGYDSNGVATIMPPDTFSYQQDNGGWGMLQEFSPPTDLHYALLADVNGDGYVDILSAMRLSGNSVRGAWLGDGTGKFATSTAYVPPFDFYALTADCQSVLCDLGVRVADVNGDGLEDLVSKGGTALNTGSGWDTSDGAWASPLPFANGATNYGNIVYAEIGDINGDGLPDVYKVWQEGFSTFNDTYLNNGHGFTQVAGWTIPQDSPKTGRVAADVNGDGLSEFVRGYADWYGNHAAAYINTGKGSWKTNPAYVLPLILQTQWQDNGVRVFDVNGDGLPDVNRSARDTYGFDQGRDVYLNTGSGWAYQANGHVSPVPLSYVNVSGPSGTVMGDIDGNGMTDVMSTQNLNGNDIRQAALNSSVPVDRLVKINYRSGGSTDVSYKPSTQYQANGKPANPNLPMIVQTVNQLSTSDGNGAIQTANFSYAGGTFYYGNAYDRKFAGFAEIDETDSAGNVIKTFYHTGKGTDSAGGEFQDNYFKIGKPYRVEQYDNSGKLYKKTVKKWDSADLGNGAGFVKLVQTLDLQYDGLVVHADTAQSYVYDNSTGNVIQTAEWGEVSGNGDGSFVDTGLDKFVTDNTYAAAQNGLVREKVSDSVVTAQSGAKAKQTRYYYDNLPLGSVGAGNLTRQEFWKSDSMYVNVQKTYNSLGLVTQTRDQNGNFTAYAYDQYNLYPASVTNALNQATQYTYDYGSGKVKQTVDANGMVFKTVYDGLGRPLQQLQPDAASPGTLVAKSAFAYTDTPSAMSVQRTDYLNASTSAVTVRHFDGLGRVIQTRGPAEGGSFSVSDTLYDNRGLVQKTSLPYFSPGPAKTAATANSQLYTSYAYDALGRTVQASNSIGSTLTAYAQRRATVTDPKSNVKELLYDARGNLASVIEHNGTSSYATLYEYDYVGNLTKLTDALGNVRNFTYDGLGKRLSAEDLHAPAVGSAATWYYNYDPVGNLIQSQNPKGQTIQYTYDSLNRKTGENYTGQTGTEVVFTYDSCANGKGRLCGRISSGLTEQYSYMPTGEISAETKTIGGKNYQTLYAYDRQGNQVLITNPDSSQISYAYNTAGLIEQVMRKEANSASFQSVVSNFDYSPTGQVALINYASGATVTNTYDPAKLYRLTKKVSAAAGASVQDISYTYDPVGNITKLVDASGTQLKKTADYGYDSLYRLTSAVITNTASSTPYTQLFDYNALGNMVSLTMDGKTIVYSYKGDGSSQGTDYANPHAVTSASTTAGSLSLLSAAPEKVSAAADISFLAVLPKLNTNFTVSINSTRDERGGTSLPVINSFTSLPNSINPGGSSVLSWALSGGAPTSLTISPNIGSVLGQTGITVTPTQTTNYILTASNSAGVASQQATVTVNTPQAAAPQFSPPGGSFTGPVQITLSSATPGASIYYTTDGSIPNLSSTLYTAPFTLSTGATVKAMTVKSGYANSQVSSQTYTITVPPSAPVINTFTANPTTITSGQSTTLSWTLSGGSPTTLTIDNGVGSVLNATSTVVFPSVTTTYILTASNASGPVSKQVTVTVQAPPPPPPSTNLALNKPASQSSTYPSLNNVGPEKAVDGNTNGSIQRRGLDNSIAYTDYESSPWWQVDLGQSYTLSSIEIWNMTDCCSNLNDYWVFVSNTPFGPGDNPSTLSSRSDVWSSHKTSAPSPSTVISTLNVSGSNVSGRFVRVQLNAPGYLTLAEVKVLGSTAPPPVSPPVINTFTANPTTITSGQSTTLSWTISGGSPTTLTIDNGVGNVLNATSTVVSPSTTTTYTLTASNSPTPVTKQVTVTVQTPPPPPPSAPIINTFTASSTAITLGQSSVLSWTLSGATSTALSIDQGVGSVLGKSFVTVTPATTTTYTLTATANSTSTSKSVMVTVSPPPPSDQKFKYDQNGNMLSDGTSTYVWDYNNRLIQVSAPGPGFVTAVSVYDPEGQRVRYDVTVASTTTTTYYPSKYYNESGSQPTRHIFANGMLIATVVGTGASSTLYTVLTDHLSGSSVMLNQNNQIVETTDYYPYGSLRLDNKTTNYSEQRKYIGEEYDQPTGLNYLNARYYNSNLNRFISQDPLFLEIGGDLKKYNKKLSEILTDPQTLNSYSYGNNNPLTKSDSLGLSAVSLNYNVGTEGGVPGLSGAISGSIGLNLVRNDDTGKIWLVPSVSFGYFGRFSIGKIDLTLSYPRSPSNANPGVFGGNAGSPLSASYSQYVQTPEDLRGVSDNTTFNINSVSFGMQRDEKNNPTYVLGAGPQVGASVSFYPTKTWIIETKKVMKTVLSSTGNWMARTAKEQIDKFKH